MANRQTRQLKKKNWSLKVNPGVPVDNQNRDCSHFTIFEYPVGVQPSKRKTAWQGCKSARDGVIYPAECKHRAPKN